MKRPLYTANLSSTNDLPDWRAKARCATLPDKVLEAIFWVDQGESVREAKQTCEACPVRAQCLEWALSLPARQTEFGVWGGYSGRELRRLRAGEEVRGHRRQIVGKRTLVPAEAFRSVLAAQIGTRFPNRWQLCLYVQRHSGSPATSVESFIAGDGPRVSYEWASEIARALGWHDLPSQLWPEVVAA
jgi:WhiB family redox-sensing transcriptional regulator